MTDPKRLLDSAMPRSEPARLALEAARDARPLDQVTREVWTGLLTRLPALPGSSSASPPAGAESGTLELSGSGAANGGVTGTGSALAGTSKTAIGLTAIIKALSTGIALGLIAGGGTVAVKSAIGRDTGTGTLAVTTSPEPSMLSNELVSVERRSSQVGTTSLHAAGSPAAASLERPPSAVQPAVAPSAPARSENRDSLRTQQRTFEDRPLRETGSTAAFRVKSEEGRSSTAGSEPSASQRIAQAASADPPARSGNRTHDAVEEGALLARAREALRAGASNRAFELLDEASRRFAHGQLGQEREVLLIEALFLTGEHSRAREHALRFLRTHSESAHAVRVRAFLR
jgi:hypothetical protein